MNAYCEGVPLNVAIYPLNIIYKWPIDINNDGYMFQMLIYGRGNVFSSTPQQMKRTATVGWKFYLVITVDVVIVIRLWSADTM